MMATNVLAYTASLTLPSGQLYTFQGSQSLVGVSTAALQAAAVAMGADISSQLVNGTVNDPSIAVQQSIDALQA